MAYDSRINPQTSHLHMYKKWQALNRNNQISYLYNTIKKKVNDAILRFEYIDNEKSHEKILAPIFLGPMNVPDVLGHWRC